MAFANRSSVRVDGRTLPLSSRAITACVVPIAFATCSCGTCADLCPQQIEIAEWMPRVSALLG
ncbi:MAG: hypothetical protein ABSC47_07605 [Terracidiphilus sp.]